MSIITSWYRSRAIGGGLIFVLMGIGMLIFVPRPHQVKKKRVIVAKLKRPCRSYRLADGSKSYSCFVKFPKKGACWVHHLKRVPKTVRVRVTFKQYHSGDRSCTYKGEAP